MRAGVAGLYLFAGVILAGLLVCAGAPAKAGSGTAVRGPASLAVKGAVDGDTLALADGTRLRLAAIQAPRLDPGWPQARPWPLAAAARAMLDHLTRGRRLVFRPVKPPRDRFGRRQAYAFDQAGNLVQAEMVARGLARVYVLADGPGVVPKGRGGTKLFHLLLVQEAAARRAHRGIWALSFYRVLDPQEAAARGDGYRIIRGRVLNITLARKATYLDFGRDHRHDLTVLVPRRARRALGAGGIDLSQLAGRTIRVRGWLTHRPEPAMLLTRPQQIEILPRGPLAGEIKK